MFDARVWNEIRKRLRDPRFTTINAHCFGHVNFGFRNENDLILLSEWSSNLNAGLGSGRMSSGAENASQWICEAYDRGLISSYCFYSETGLAVSLIESCLSGQIGATVKIRAQGQPMIDVLLGTSDSSLLITVSPDNLIAFQDLAAIKRNPVSVIGKVGGDILSVSVASRHWDGPEEQEIIHLSLKELEDEWKSSSSLQKN